MGASGGQRNGLWHWLGWSLVSVGAWQSVSSAVCSFVLVMRVPHVGVWVVVGGLLKTQLA